jgi:hypothetical protein
LWCSNNHFHSYWRTGFKRQFTHSLINNNKDIWIREFRSIFWDFSVIFCNQTCLKYYTAEFSLAYTKSCQMFLFSLFSRTGFKRQFTHSLINNNKDIWIRKTKDDPITKTTADSRGRLSYLTCVHCIHLTQNKKTW